MGDSEAVVAQTSQVTGYTSVGYTSTGHDDTSSNAVPSSAEATGVFAASATLKNLVNVIPEGYNFGDGTTYRLYSSESTAMRETYINATNETKPAAEAIDTTENLAGLENAAVEPSQPVTYDSSINGNVDSEAGNAMVVENGNALDYVGGVGVEQQFVDGSVPAISAKED